jgi:hypothetical protein
MPQSRIADTIYANIEFAPYSFKEFPKWIKLQSGKQVLVNTRKEELDATTLEFDTQHVVSDSERERNELAEDLALERAKRQELEEKLAILTRPVASVETSAETSKPIPSAVKKA